MATPIFTCGFECGQLGTVGQHWEIGGGTPTFSTTTVRSGARSLRFNPSAATAFVTSPTGTGWSVFAGGSSPKVFRFYVRFTTLPDASTVIWNTSDVGGGGDNTTGVYFNQTDSKIYARYAGSSGASGVTVGTGVWYLIDYKQDWLNGTCDVSVDTTECGQASGAADSGTVWLVQAGPMSAVTTDMFIDDVLVSETGADYPLGAGYVNHFVPTSDGTHNVAGANDFERGTTGTDITNATTDAYLLVDEVPLDDTTPDADDFINMVAPPNATDYVELVFGAAPGVSVPAIGPRTVEVIAAIHQAGTTTGWMNVRINDNGTTGAVYNAVAVAGTTTITYKRANFADPPSAASAWNAAGDGGNGDFLDLRVQFGSSGLVDANPDQYLDAIMVEAEFEQRHPSAGSGAAYGGAYYGQYPYASVPVSAVTTEQVISAALSAASAMVRSAGKIVSDSLSLTPSIARSVGKIASAALTSTSTIVRSVGKAVSAALSAAASLAAYIVIPQSLSAALSATSTMVRSTGKVVSATATTVATVARSVGKIVSAAPTTAATISKSISKTVSTTATAAATSLRSVGLTVSAATLTAVASMVRSAGLSVSATATTTATMAKSFGKIVSAAVTATATLSTTYLKPLRTIIITISQSVLKAVVAVSKSVLSVHAERSVSQLGITAVSSEDNLAIHAEHSVSQLEVTTDTVVNEVN